MPDHASNELPRIALVYGQEAAVAHVREAVSGHVEVVYAAGADEFDTARMTGAQATAALVNLDDGDWLDAIEASLHAAGVAVVYNDPEISRGLDGWERARWLRHLVAKLSGSHDIDPPRPEPVEPRAPNTTVADGMAIPVAAAGDEPGLAVASTDPHPMELPLSPEEIATMTVDLAAGQHLPAGTDPAGESLVANDMSADMLALDQAVDEAAASATRAGERARADDGSAVRALPAANADNDFDADAALDVDTEALSAMIDARLAQASGPEALPDSPQVWRVANGGAVSPVQLDGVTVPAADEKVVAPPVGAEPAPPAQDDADVLASLPSLDDWALVDPEAPLAQAEASGNKVQESPLLDSFAGLELVPMETIAPVHVKTDPIERWLHESEPAKPRTDAAAKTGGAGA